MDLTAIFPRLRDHRVAQLSDAVAMLEAGIAAGVIKNADFVAAKETINRAVSDAYDHYQDESRDYDHMAPLIMGAFNVPSGIKQSGSNAARRSVLTTLLPLHELLQRAKPLVVKRQTGPGAPKTALQIEREAATMTCQCCGKRYLANIGTIAHHGYQRSGGGWQTASCSGAKRSPFEVSRDYLGILIQDLKTWDALASQERHAVADESRPVTLRFTDTAAPRDRRGRRPVVSLSVTRETFEATRAARAADLGANGFLSFAVAKSYDLDDRDREIKGVRDEIVAQQARYDGWKKTRRWDDGAWKPVEITEAA